MSSIGFVGPGIMGAPMITNLVAAGHQVLAYGRSEMSCTRILAAGAQVAGSPAEVADGADLVITMLPDTPDVEDVLGTGGLAAALMPGQIFVDMSTIRPDTTRDIHHSLAERGIMMLDAPVSGGEAAAHEGTLSIMVGGEASALDEAREVLECLGATITHVGPAGAGQLTKAANQLIVAANIQAVSEAIVLLESAGADLTSALAAINGGLAGSTVLTRKREAFINGSFEPGFRITLHNKDLRIVCSAADGAGIALPMTALVSQLMVAAVAQGLGHLDHSALLTLIRTCNSSH
ncbi:2-hydroxy-3-oxopropionate reductase [Ruania alba]|uniref:2-hydroxy-3-oxopropionate reductase n=1 Tax=Ruania alba TaxID=648782 RepID=A0A1H5H6X0_9MICO|nr:2-hydroxy-3-oxopropionate reductase [Ruania alba]SEE23689.1 2-hydroxy-3-oxopropionate reductase [Ruania alba]